MCQEQASGCEEKRWTATGLYLLRHGCLLQRGPLALLRPCTPDSAFLSSSQDWFTQPFCLTACDLDEWLRGWREPTSSQASELRKQDAGSVPPPAYSRAHKALVALPSAAGELHVSQRHPWDTKPYTSPSIPRHECSRRKVVKASVSVVWSVMLLHKLHQTSASPAPGSGFESKHRALFAFWVICFFHILNFFH